MSYTATKDKRSRTRHERSYLINVHFFNYSTIECHVTRTEVVTTLARPGFDTNGSVKWFEANSMRIQFASLRMRIRTGLSVKRPLILA